MSKIILVIGLFCFFMNLYYFFYEKNLFLGSIAMVLTIAVNFMYAMTSKVNEVNEEDKNN